MRLTIRAGFVREGDRLIVPDGEIVVPKGYPLEYAGSEHILLTWPVMGPKIIRHRDELVVVERPDPPITIPAFDLTSEEAEAALESLNHFTKNVDIPLDRARRKIRAAIVAARAGETQ